MHPMQEETFESSESGAVPETLRPLFWDHDFDDLTLKTDATFIISRILASGSWDAVCWLRDHLGDQALRQWILTRKGRPLTSQQLRFWELVLELPHDLVNNWLREEPRRLWDAR